MKKYTASQNKLYSVEATDKSSAIWKVEQCGNGDVIGIDMFSSSITVWDDDETEYGCKYCKMESTKIMPNIVTDGDFSAHIYENQLYLIDIFDGINYEQKVKIKFCPMCGNEL